MSTVSELTEKLAVALDPVSVTRLGDRGTGSLPQQFVNVHLAGTEYPDLDINSAVKISEIVSVVSWTGGDSSEAEELADRVQLAIFATGWRVAVEGRSEIFDTERFGDFCGVESSYRIWR